MYYFTIRIFKTNDKTQNHEKKWVKWEGFLSRKIDSSEIVLAVKKQTKIGVLWITYIFTDMN